MRITLLALLLAVGCGSSSITDLEGIYRVSTWTENLTACDAEGPSVAAQRDMFFYIKDENFIGQHFVNVELCADAATCKTEATDEGTIHIGMFGFDKGSDSKGWTSHSAHAFAISGQCQGGVTDTVMTSSNKMIRIEQRQVDATPFPAGTGSDECPDAMVESAAAGQPCKSFEVVTAAFDSSY